jgi:hypothetical protein
MSVISSAMLARKNCIYMCDSVAGSSAHRIAADWDDMDGLR